VDVQDVGCEGVDWIQLSETNMSIVVFWVVTRCGLADGYQLFCGLL
jgi:hypothetical protein